MGLDAREAPRRPPSALWRETWVALGLSEAGTIVLGGALFAVQQNVWWVGFAGVLSLMGGGVYLAWRSGEAEPLYGARLAVLYFAVVLVVLFGGSFADRVPDPLPGLAHGDSTFFFVWPLLQLAGAVTGTMVGGRLPGSRRER